MRTHTEVLFWLTIVSQVAGLFASGIIIGTALSFWFDCWRNRQRDHRRAL